MVELANALGYSGDVTVTLTNTDSIPVHLHNEGCKALWNALAMAMTGYDISNKRPHYFMVARKKHGQPFAEPCLTHKIPFVGGVWGDTVANDLYSTSARFTATVTKKDRISTINDSLGYSAQLIMYSKDGEELAKVEDLPDRRIARAHNSMITGVDAVYEWKLTFKNVSSVTPTAGSEI